MFQSDPFADASPWDTPATAAGQTAEETPMNTTPEPTAAPATPLGAPPFEIGLTAKAGSDFGAEWLTPRVSGYSAEETALRGVELLTAMKKHGLIDLNAQFAQYTRDQYKGGSATAPKRFENGKVVPAKPEAGTAGYTCEHGPRSFKDGGSWAAYFCGDRDRPKNEQCPPLWRQKDGSYRA